LLADYVVGFWLLDVVLGDSLDEWICDKIEDLLVNKYLKGKKIVVKI
jgi:hypothetical protein